MQAIWGLIISKYFILYYQSDSSTPIYLLVDHHSPKHFKSINRYSKYRSKSILKSNLGRAVEDWMKSVHLYWIRVSLLSFHQKWLHSTWCIFHNFAHENCIISIFLAHCFWILQMFFLSWNTMDLADFLFWISLGFFL